jgi:hypothetical protein
MLRSIESLIVRLESPDRQEVASWQSAGVDVGDGGCAPASPDVEGSQERPSAESDDVCFVHSFDTDRRDLERCGHVLELREGQGNVFLVAARSGSIDGTDLTRRAQAQIERACALQILSGEMSPLAALEQRLGRPGPGPVENVRAIIGGRRLQRIDSHVADTSLKTVTGRAPQNGSRP